MFIVNVSNQNVKVFIVSTEKEQGYGFDISLKLGQRVFKFNVMYTKEELQNYIGCEWKYDPDKHTIYKLTKIDDEYIYWISSKNDSSRITIASFIECLEEKTYYFTQNNYEIY